MAVKRYRKATADDGAYLCKNLRLQDRDELESIHGLEMDFSEVLDRCVSKSIEAFVLEVNGVPVCMFGISWFNEKKNSVCPWLLGSEALHLEGKELVKKGKECVVRWSKKYDTLINFVHSENMKTVKWLSRIGFKIHTPVKYGVYGEEFFPFTINWKE